MDKVCAELVLLPQGYGPEGTLRVPLCRTEDPRALRFLKDLIIGEMQRTAAQWAHIDGGGVATLEDAEAEKTRQILSLLIPEEQLKPDLRPVGCEPNA